ncbi:MFS transporter [Luteimonas terricola]|uniref:MFS transporter n=1 Tax=Luteimonas terricola TaxID=645597 RepID=A0ABQ2E4T9_9GAMM|nr:MFS transporter [Luteimonas terricola]GGJ95777.1 MFS transporter [Luteimonas terricola]
MSQAAPTPPDPAPRPSALSAMRYPIFRRVWFASASSNFGGMIQSVGAAWLMTSIAQSADMVALVQASVALPVMLFSLVAGAMADNFDRRRMMLGAQLFMLLVSVVLALCAWAGLITPWLLLLFTFLIGCGAAFNAPAWQASVGDMVPRAELPGAVAINSMGFNIARSVGPAIGGAIVAAAGAAAAFAINAVSYIALIVVLARWRPAPGPRLLPREALGGAIAAGVRYVAMSPAIRTILGRAAVFGVGASAPMALMPLVARDLIAGGPLTYGLLLGAFGLGAIAGAMGSTRLRDLLSTEGLVRCACIAFAVAAAVVAMSTLLLLTMAGLLLGGAAWVLALSTFNVTVQLSTPRWVVARALSLYQMAAFGGMALGSWLWGFVAEHDGVRTALLAAALVMVVCAVLGRWMPLAKLTELNLDPLSRWQEPATAVPVQARTGPVVITVEYIIREEDVLEFLGAMAERRRIRRRDGARNWRVLRDLADPQVWIERYETPTWLEYIRHNSRLTHDDATIPEHLRALHRGPGGPRVQRMIERQTSALHTVPASGPQALTEPVTESTRGS